MAQAARARSAAIPRETIIQVSGITKSFKDVKAVDGVDLKIGRGEAVALLGPNGAGKTTLVEMIEGIQSPDDGEIRIQGRTWEEGGRDLRRLLGITLQETRFTDKLTVVETLDLFGSFYGRTRSRSLEVLESIRLQEKAKSHVGTLSGGQKQRLALGIAVINEPSVLLLDEPTTGLDPHARRDLWAIVHELKTRGTTLVLTTHYMEEAEALCDRIVILYGGRILAEGTLQELLLREGAGEIIEFSSSSAPDEAEMMRVKTAATFSYDAPSGRGKLTVKDMQKALPDFLSRIKRKKISIGELQCRRMTLDDLFIRMTGKHLDE